VQPSWQSMTALYVATGSISPSSARYVFLPKLCRLAHFCLPPHTVFPLLPNLGL
jgi:hypothetical protein